MLNRCLKQMIELNFFEKIIFLKSQGKRGTVDKIIDYTKSRQVLKQSIKHKIKKGQP